MEKKSFRSRVSVLLIVIIFASLSIKLFIAIFHHQDIQGACIIGGVLLFAISIFFGIRYVISRNKLHIKMCWIIPFWSVSVADITSVKRSYNPLSSPAASLKRLLVCSKQGDKLISPVREQEFCDVLIKINPDISINLDNKKPWRNIWSRDISVKTTAQQIDQTVPGDQAIKAPRVYPRPLYIVPFVFMLLLASFMFYMVSLDPQVVFTSNTCQIKGAYGVNIPFAGITDIDIIALHEMPRISRRTNGISFSKVHRGNYRTVNGENIRLSINSSANTVIRIIDHNGKTYFINRKSEDETKQIFNKIAQRVNSASPKEAQANEIAN